MKDESNYIAELIRICESIDIDEEGVVVKAALALGEQPGVSDEVRSLATDAMLIAQHDYAGEFESKEQLLDAVRALNTQAQ